MRIKQAVEQRLVPANRDSSVLIKECDVHNVHVRLHRLTLLPSDPFRPIHNQWIQQFELPTWLKMQSLKNDPRMPVDWCKASLVNSFEIVHFPVTDKK